MGIAWVLWVFYKRGCEILGISLLVLVAIQRISDMLPTNMSGTKLSIECFEGLFIFYYRVIFFMFYKKTVRKTWENYT